MINAIVNSGPQSVADASNATPPTPTTSADASTGASTSPPATAAQTSPVDSAKIADAVSKLNNYVQHVQRDLSFSVDKATGRTVIKIYDAQTKQVIRQLPPEETLQLAASIDKQLSHLLLKDKA